MKLSLSWIFDHIDGDWRKYDIAEIIARFNATTAEIEDWYEITYPLASIAIAQVTQIGSSEITVTIPEWNKEFNLISRPDAALGDCFFVINDQKRIRWLTLMDLHCQKDGLVPVLQVESESMMRGTWKQAITERDYILIIDNKSITHRPDMWGHRGCAREIAAFLNLNLVQEEYFLADKPIKHADKQARAQAGLPVDVAIATDVCKRLAVLSIPEIKQRGSDIYLLFRLTSIDARPINAVVDATNYVMYDWGQPMHAFDRKKITGSLIARQAHQGEKLTLLDGEEIILRPQDCVIADTQHPLALAGIMGGKDCGVDIKTTALIVESANFDAAPIRLSATHFKKRTEASMRFEKSLDPLQNTQALLRFLKVLSQAHIPYEAAESIISLGEVVKQRRIVVDHACIQERLGTTLSHQQVIALLTQRGFGVLATAMGYEITIPSFRVAKDISIKEDIIEEVGRSYGYNNIVGQLPVRATKPFSLHMIMRTRILKNYCAQAINGHEVANYALYNEDFLKIMKWQPTDAIYLKNPLSEARSRLVTSLIPHLLQNVAENAPSTDEDLKFFELNRVWSLSNGKAHEYKRLAYVYSSKRAVIDFYEQKNLLQGLFAHLGMLVEWQPVQEVPHPWYSKYQTARLVVEGDILGYAGMGSVHLVDPLLERSTFICELDGQLLLDYKRSSVQYEPLSKYPAVSFDLSILAPTTVLVADIETALAHIDPRIKQVKLIDYFTRPEWRDKHSITVRCTVVDEYKTLSRSEIDELMVSAQQAVKALGVELR